MEKQKIFYYSFNKTNLLFAMTLLLTVMALSILRWCPYIYLLWQMQVFALLVVFFWGVWFLLYVVKHKMLIINDDSIKIDHCNPLKWKDIDHAEIQRVRYCICEKSVIALIPKKKIKYQYNFLQKQLMKRGNGFPAFSIPLYEIVSPADAIEIYNIIAEKIKFK